MKYVIELPDTDCYKCPLCLFYEKQYETCALDKGMNLEELDVSETHGSRPSECPLNGHGITDRDIDELAGAYSQLDMLATVMLADDKKPIWERIHTQAMAPIYAMLKSIEGRG